MRRAFVLLVGVLVGLCSAGIALAQEFDDVPADHWAYEAIDYLQQAGLVEGYPDGTFKGNRAFTRYEMAMVIARVFTKLSDWQVAMENGRFEVRITSPSSTSSSATPARSAANAPPRIARSGRRGCVSWSMAGAASPSPIAAGSSMRRATR